MDKLLGLAPSVESHDRQMGSFDWDFCLIYFCQRKYLLIRS